MNTNKAICDRNVIDCDITENTLPVFTDEEIDSLIIEVANDILGHKKLKNICKLCNLIVSEQVNIDMLRLSVSNIVKSYRVGVGWCESLLNEKLDYWLPK
ncbi:MAG: hypothetical protein ACRC6V_00505 [Bacteroidales bacterium]